MTEVNENVLEELAGKVMTDVAGAMGVLLGYIGDQTGVYSALGAQGPCTAKALAENLGMNDKYVHEWLASSRSSKVMKKP